MPEKLTLFAEPWWVNLLFFLPFFAFYFWKNKLNISAKALIVAAIFGAAFGIVEAVCVVYIREIMRLLGNIPDGQNYYSSVGIFSQFPRNLWHIEIARESATMVMLVSVAYLSAKNKFNRFAIFFWTFAFWDIFYYVGLYLALGWPQSLTTQDVLFLIPVPWYSQIWFPILISLLFIAAVIFA